MESCQQKDPFNDIIEPVSDTKSLQNLSNPRGRPRLSISFCPQPKSIVSQLLSEIKARRSNKHDVNSKITLETGLQTKLVEKYFAEIKPQLISSEAENEILGGFGNVADFETTTEEFETFNQDAESLKLKVSTKLNPTKKRKKNSKIAKVCNNKKQLQDHLSPPEDLNFSCGFAECTYKTKMMSNLLKHKRVHTNERPFLCDQCPFRSNFVNSLKVHKRIHTSERPYCCEQCGHRCNSISNLKKHSLHKHKIETKIINNPQNIKKPK